MFGTLKLLEGGPTTWLSRKSPSASTSRDRRERLIRTDATAASRVFGRRYHDEALRMTIDHAKVLQQNRHCFELILGHHRQQPANCGHWKVHIARRLADDQILGYDSRGSLEVAHPQKGLLAHAINACLAKIPTHGMAEASRELGELKET